MFIFLIFFAMNTKVKSQLRARRKSRTNTTIKASFPELRCIVFRSLKHISAQLITRDGMIVAAITDLGLKGTKTEKAFEAGKLLAKKASEKKMTSCVFDRNGFLYHGRIKSLCEGLREGGMTI